MPRKAGFKHSEATKRKIGNANRIVVNFVCSYCKKINICRPSDLGNYDKHFCNKECYGKYLHEIAKPEDHPRWKGGVSPTNQLGRGTNQYFKWRRLVFERDGFKCIWCGSTEKLEADHIKRWVDYPELRLEVDNGRTLCFNCHLTTRKVTA